LIVAPLALSARERDAYSYSGCQPSALSSLGVVWKESQREDRSGPPAAPGL
jgi:hypothetical protein